MADRSWYYAAQGQQQGPISEVQLDQLIARGTVNNDTLVWSDGMAGWEKAGQVPGLMAAQAGTYPATVPGTHVDSASYAGTPSALSAQLGLWAYLGWSLLLIVGEFLVVLTPWTAVYLYRYVAARMRVPGRPNLSFIGQPFEIWYVFMALGVLIYISLIGNNFVHFAVFVVQAFLSWMITRWVFSRLASDGEPLPIRFEGNAVVYFGWYLLTMLASFTVIGWAWALTAWMRWVCRNIQGTRREVIFTASGWQVLWRTILFSLGCAFIIPIPWLLRWYTQWYISQFALVPRNALPAA